MTYRELLAKYPIISNQIDAQGLGVVLGQLEHVLVAGVDGAVVELGCYRGSTSLFIRRVLDAAGQFDRPFHVYDSFAGLPPKTIQDASGAGTDFVAGELSVSKRDFLHEFKHASLKPPRVHKGWFSDLTPEDLPEPIAFAFLDGDFYESIYDSLKLVWPRLAPGGTVVIDDYSREALPGVARAVRDYFEQPGTQPYGRLQVLHNRAVITA
jgi:O-methyltransferase